MLVQDKQVFHLKRRVAVIVAVIALAVVLVTLNALIVPVPVAGNPIAVLEFVQVYVVLPPVLTVEKQRL